MKPSLIASAVCTAAGFLMIVISLRTKKWQHSLSGSALCFLGAILAFTSY